MGQSCEKLLRKMFSFCVFFIGLSQLVYGSDIALVVIAIGKSYEKVVEAGYLNKQEYCLRHGYDFIYINEFVDPSRHPSWNKIPVAQMLFAQNKYRWIYMNDADSLIMNQAVRLEDLIDDNYDVILTRDCNNLNAGQMLLKNSEWNKIFLEKVYSHTEFINHSWWEQMAIITEYEKDPEVKKRIKVLPQRMMNSYVLEAYPPNFFNGVNEMTTFFQPGDFVIHFPCVKSALSDFMFKYAKQAVCNESLIDLDAYLKYYDFQLSPQNSDANARYCTAAQQKEMRAELASIHPQVHRIVEIGFHAGHSADLFLQECPKAKIISFDWNRLPQTKVGVEFMQRKYKNRFYFVEGDSHATIAQHTQTYPWEKADLIFLDGDRSVRGRYQDLVDCQKFATPETIVWLNDSNDALARVVNYAVKQGLVKIIGWKSAKDSVGDRHWVQLKYLH